MSRRRWRDRPELIAHDVVTRALHRVGGLEPGPWSEALEVLTGSIDVEARLHRAGRQRARRELVDLVAARADTAPAPAVPSSSEDAVPMRDEDGARAIWVLGLPGTGAGDLAEHVGARLGTPPVDPMLRGFVSISFEVRWHAPSYGEWLATADLAPAYREVAARLSGSERPAHLFTGWGHLERLGELAAAMPASRIVVVEPDGSGDDPCDVVAASSARSRRRDSAEVDDEKVARYWAWRVGDLTDRYRLALDALPADRVLRLSASDVGHGVARPVDRAVDRILDDR